MSREIHVRFWEGVGVRFPHATRLWYRPKLTYVDREADSNLGTGRAGAEIPHDTRLCTVHVLTLE